MNQRPTGHLIGTVHLAPSDVGDDKLTERIRHTFTCSCGVQIRGTDPAELRAKANDHAKVCGRA